MESAANLHQLQDQLLVPSSSSLPIIPSCFGHASTHGWTPNPSLNNIHNSNSSMALQDLGFQWSAENLLSHHSLPNPQAEKFTQMLNNPSCTNQDLDLNDLSHKLSIKINGGDFYNISRSNNNNNNNNNRPHFAQIYPSINVSNWNLSTPAPAPAFSNCLDLNLQTPADLFAAAGNFGFHDQIQPSKHGRYNQLYTFVIMTPFTNEVTEPKRPCNSMEPRVNQHSPPLKKSRSDSRSVCPPLKVRKEKLGDRIAALQQLVAPFGKTDTASVLMEAIGYIKFLQNQVETLSVPYMKPSSKPTHRSWEEDENEGQPNRDLRSRGLCLVPVGCLSYMAGDGGGGAGIWPPPGYNGGASY